jgi:mannose-6-phosphate isomerase
LKIDNSEMTYVPKVWGFERWICNSAKYCGKLLHIDEGHASSYHYHNIKDEHMYVTSGVLKIIHGFEEEENGETTLVHEGDAFYIPVGLRHRLIAHEGPVEFFEFSTQHFDSDSIRVSLGY